MARPKAWWKADVFSYGRKYNRGKVTGFHIAVRADDGTPNGRVVDVEIPDATLRIIIESGTAYLSQDEEK